MAEALEAFDGLDEVLGTNFVSSDNLTEEVPALVPDSENKPLSEDKLYLMNQLKKIDHDLEEVMVLLKRELKIGAKPIYHSVFAQLTKMKLETCKEMRELNFAYDDKVNGNKKASKSSVNLNTNINLTGNDLFALAEQQRKLADMEEVKIVEV